ncbi:MAG: hypothetical protein J7605_02735 [Variovorax sp.]|nr:hypothetical protein [Variovorax sp.]
MTGRAKRRRGLGGNAYYAQQAYAARWRPQWATAKWPSWLPALRPQLRQAAITRQQAASKQGASV